MGALAGALAAVTLAVVLAARACGRGERAGVADWCAPGLEPLGDACFAGASGEAKGLVVYLHGRYPPERAAEETDRQSRVARMASARGFAVLALRGKQGACPAPEVASYWCWPSSERTQDAGPEAVAAWGASLEAAEARTGKVPRYLLGFSNGAYFAALIATRALARFDAIAIVSGGPVEPTKARGAKPPILLVTADDDAAQDEMLRLEAELRREGWPSALTSREGGHALTDFDVDAALGFFLRTQQRAKSPFGPPFAARRPLRDAAAPAVASAVVTPAAVEAADAGDPTE